MAGVSRFPSKARHRSQLLSRTWQAWLRASPEEHSGQAPRKAQQQRQALWAACWERRNPSSSGPRSTRTALALNADRALFRNYCEQFVPNLLQPFEALLVFQFFYSAVVPYIVGCFDLDDFSP